MDTHFLITIIIVLIVAVPVITLICSRSNIKELDFTILKFFQYKLKK